MSKVKSKDSEHGSPQKAQWLGSRCVQTILNCWKKQRNSVCSISSRIAEKEEEFNEKERLEVCFSTL